MKITLKNPKPAAAASSEAPATEPPIPTPTSAKPGGLKLKLTSSAAPPTDAAAAPASEAPKPKRKYTKKPKVDENGQPLPTGKAAPKKRAREDNGEGGDSPVAKRKPKPTAKSLAMTADSDEEDELQEAPPPPRPVPVRTQSVKLSFKPKGGAAPAPLQRSNTAILKVKGGGKPPVRPPGVGYDSEAEEAEVDPAIESQFVLRMVPGPDCELLRKAIDDKMIGKSMSQGGPGVYFRFFDREGRRAMVTIQGRHYAASMVELPSVVESMKSWNKKDWVKTADVCQMLLVLGRVESEDEAKKYPRPSYVDPDSHRFPHGLTPPMQWARKRRFRPRKSYLDVERAEAAMNQLLVDDDDAEASRYELVDSTHETSEEESSSGEEVEEDEEMMNAPMVDTMDAGDLEQMLHAGLMEDEEVDMEALFGGNDSATIEVETPATAHDVAMHALNANGSIIMETETAASTPAAATSPDDDDDNDGESDEDADDIDEEVAAKQEKEEQTRIEIRELDKTIEENKQQLARTNNVMWKQRIQARIDKQLADRNIKLRSLGEDED